MTAPMVGILGSYGATGRAVVTHLHASVPACHFRLGGRREDLVRGQLREAHGDRAEAHSVDVLDDVALAAFCRGCNVVVNCTGPSHRILDRVARCALAAGADYVDPSGDEGLLRGLRDLISPSGERVAIVSAGMLPGLSGILPRWMSQRLERCEALTTYVGVFDQFTLAGAEDYLAGLEGSESLAAWEQGRRTSGAATRIRDLELPMFPGRVTAHPYLDSEGQRLATSLGLRRAYFYNVFEGERLLGALGAVAGTRLDGPALEAAARSLVRAARLEVAGRTPYAIYLFQLEGERSGKAATHSLMVKAVGAAELTGILTALATRAVLEAIVPTGAHFAADVLDPRITVSMLRKSSVISAWVSSDEPLTGTGAIEEGTL